MDVGAVFTSEQSPSTVNQLGRMKGVPYSEAIGSVLWPVVVSRPDAAYAVGILSQFIQNPGQAHFGGMSKNPVEGYCDADWASQRHRHSISGYSFHFGMGAVSWSSKKQHIIALSSTEAEYIAQTHAAKEGVWLKSFVEEVCGSRGGAVNVKDEAYRPPLPFYTRSKALSKPKFQRFVEMLGLRSSKTDSGSRPNLGFPRLGVPSKIVSESQPNSGFPRLGTPTKSSLNPGQPREE